jgi:hypothetical protein
MDCGSGQVVTRVGERECSAHEREEERDVSVFVVVPEFGRRYSGFALEKGGDCVSH